MNSRFPKSAFAASILALNGCASEGGTADPTIALLSEERTLTPLEPGLSGMAAGTFDAIGVSLSDWDESADRVLRPGELRIRVDPDSRTYTLTFDRADLPVPLAFDLAEEFGMHVEYTRSWSDGSHETVPYGDYTRATSVLRFPDYASPTRGRKEDMSVTYDLGLSYVSLGWWSRILSDGPLQPGDDDEYAGRDDVYFVYGLRTEQLPASGTATYHATISLSNSNEAGSWDAPIRSSPLDLQADFGNNLIAASIVGKDIQRVTSTFDTDDTLVCCTDVSITGSAALDSSGLFGIPMAGTLDHRELSGNYATHVSGNIDGALFGPHAEQIGGTFRFQVDGPGAPLVGAFIGTRADP